MADVEREYAHLYQVEDGWIETFTGCRFFFGDPQPETVHLEDVAHALSLLSRYNGHTRRFYSVAEHAVLMAGWVWAHAADADLAMTALHHDDAEAYIGDLPRPIKVTLPAFKAMEARIDGAVAAKGWTMYPFPALIKELDSRILVDERAQAMGASGNEWGTDGLEPLGIELRFWGPTEARDRFLAMHDFLQLARGGGGKGQVA